MNDIKYNSFCGESINRFLRLRAAVLKEHTIVINQRQLKSFDEYLAATKVDSITKNVVDGWIKLLSGSESTVVHSICTIRLFIEFLCASGIECYIPQIPKQHDSYIPYIFNDEEIALIIEMADSYPARWNNTIPYMRIELPVIIRIALCCGMRISEIVSLKMKDFKSDNGVIVVENGKNNKQRLIPLHESLTDLLIKYCLTMRVFGNPEAWLFPGKNNDIHVNSEKIYFRFAAILKSAGITVSKKKFERGPCFHCLRHTFVLKAFKQLQEQGICIDNSVPYLSIYLGHSSLIETECYMKFTPNMFSDEFQKFAVFTDEIFPEVSFDE